MQEHSTEAFYDRLTPVTSFSACLDDSTYTPVPDDWTVIVSDVRDSTKAIADGRYKAVNMVGAATITAVLNACDNRDLPFVFGGDGGTVIVPPSLRDASQQALGRLRTHCRSLFGLDLRVGAFPVADLIAAGQPLSVCKYQPSPGNHLGFLSGPGHDHATALLKSQEPTGSSQPLDDAAVAGGSPDLSGLTCRWEPLESRRGCILTLAVLPANGRSGEVTAAINRILDGDMGASAPVTPGSLRLTWPPRGLWLEVAARGGTARRGIAAAYVLVSSFAQLMAERFRLRVGPYDATTYRSEMAAHTDYRKLDGVIRLVLDVTPAQADGIEAYLAAQHRQGALLYGRHRASSALVTCLVKSLQDGRHIHFVDGADGGHTMAALDMKTRAANGDSPSA